MFCFRSKTEARRLTGGSFLADFSLSESDALVRITKAMMTLLMIVLWAAVVTVSITGLLGNGFILAMNGHQWFRSRKMLPCDLLLISLSGSRFLLQVVTIAGCALYYISSESSVSYYAGEVIHFTWIFLNMASLWCGTWLNVFYCLKVTSFASPLFIWLKLRVNTLVPRLLGISMVVFALFCLPTFVDYSREKKTCNRTAHPTANATQSEACKTVSGLFDFLQIIFTSLNFSINVSASILLLTSLWKHVRNLRKSGAGIKDLSTQVHINVMKPLLFSLVLYLIHFRGLILYTVDIFDLERNEPLYPELYLSFFPSTHSVILIATNPKLKISACRLRKKITS